MAVKQVFRIAPQLCPHCGYASNTATNVAQSGPPKPNDIMICIDCTEVSVYEAEGFRKPTEVEQTKLDNMREVQFARRQARNMPPRSKPSMQ